LFAVVVNGYKRGVFYLVIRWDAIVLVLTAHYIGEGIETIFFGKGFKFWYTSAACPYKINMFKAVYVFHHFCGLMLAVPAVGAKVYDEGVFKIRNIILGKIFSINKLEVE
jgi:hypothetical protein